MTALSNADIILYNKRRKRLRENDETIERPLQIGGQRRRDRHGLTRERVREAELGRVEGGALAAPEYLHV